MFKIYEFNENGILQAINTHGNSFIEEYVKRFENDFEGPAGYGESLEQYKYIQVQYAYNDIEIVQMVRFYEYI